ncbi:2-succinyl-5-enolpyruvyl-6-hydroxy-3-cyclohexene-1-carboxylic-acid synthase [Flavobacterium sp. SUN046]|uniref:2-succinyl-5-enolpyruvyl-6-hydroxy-3- cyclohexene-1-carboxylic-acid synthase n=1 Tax=Flavobacterium sp. SUN046 TaxID=3002440 RepID=UPI002DBCCA16|nr:2-succinyl-5-enolpyruvyl-6-hydroxy-3-cyclohexene-1-carboxylic-acid synthase [Flavobacterium sp. SUN046]MEC4050485.1 2-succinyl-5-enolpyruvyl-6-hydroxy-3-cyclohexene-1-carboxylic-acid synthase [Flavobacterium sp. SUN046]
MKYPKIPLAQSILEIFRAKGIQNIVISPGSRNAPLTIGFANNPYFNCYSIADERCAAFFALGIAQQLQQPVAVVCTSGSALLNYYPAYSEAFYSEIPLIVLSADRPKSKIDIGDGQTIRQENIYQNHSLYNANLEEFVSAENDWKINQAIDKAIICKGPVHINAPFEEPLYETVEELSVTPIVSNELIPEFPVENLEEYQDQWHKAKKKLVLIGGLHPNSIDQNYLDQLAQDPSVVVFTEVTSNTHHPHFVTNIDTIITPFTEADFVAFQPDVLLTIGGMIVSKRIKAFLRKYQPQHHWHVDELRAYNTYGCLTKHFEMTPNAFLNKIKSKTLDSDYQSKMLAVRANRALKHTAYLNTIPFTDFKAFDAILSQLQPNSQLQISNSSPIRYAQLFAIDPTVEVYCNRGTSGIDGSTSTAIGASVANGKPTVLITGDIGFLYDSNALWNNYIPKDFKIILLNNGGGGIFRILPGHDETPVFNTFFETSHQLTAEHLAKMYGLEYHSAQDEVSLKESLVTIFDQNQKPVLLEVFTPTIENDKVLLQYFKSLVDS